MARYQLILLEARRRQMLCGTNDWKDRVRGSGKVRRRAVMEQVDAVMDEVDRILEELVE